MCGSQTAWVEIMDPSLNYVIQRNLSILNNPVSHWQMGKTAFLTSWNLNEKNECLVLRIMLGTEYVFNKL